MSKDLKKQFPNILEYVKEHDCSFSQAIKELSQAQQKRNLKYWF